mgnify:CR=1 FL=1
MQAKTPSSPLMPIYTESINMLEGLTEEEAEEFLTDHSNIVPLYAINMAELDSPYQMETSKEWAE